MNETLFLLSHSLRYTTHSRRIDANVVIKSYRPHCQFSMTLPNLFILKRGIQ